MDRDSQSVERACALLHRVLDETRGMDRRAFVKALMAVAPGSALISAMTSVSLGPLAAAETPVTAFVFGGAWKRAAVTAFGEPFTAKTGIPMQYQEP